MFVWFVVKILLSSPCYSVPNSVQLRGKFFSSFFPFTTFAVPAVIVCRFCHLWDWHILHVQPEPEKCLMPTLLPLFISTRLKTKSNRSVSLFSKYLLNIFGATTLYVSHYDQAHIFVLPCLYPSLHLSICLQGWQARQEHNEKYYLSSPVFQTRQYSITAWKSSKAGI